MKLYHGSSMEIVQPDLSRSKPFKDFGQGFYLSSDYKQAEALAKLKAEQLQTCTPFVTTFEWDERTLDLPTLRVKVFEDYCKEWAEFVFVNRNRNQIHPTHSFDIVIGPIADDGVTFQLRRFDLGIIPIEKLIEELKYSKGLTIQYYFGSEHALSHLKKL